MAEFRYGYVRVSSTNQNEERQRAQILENNVDERNIFVDKQSGKDFDRPAYQQLKERLREGDTVVIHEFDRLGRNYTELKKEFEWFSDHGVQLVFLDNKMLSTEGKSDLEQKLILNIIIELMSYIAEKERLHIRKRCEEGIAVAKANGVKFGRPKIEWPDNFSLVMRKWLNHEITSKSAMALCHLKRSTFYRMSREYLENHNYLQPRALQPFPAADINDNPWRYPVANNNDYDDTESIFGDDDDESDF